MMQAQAQAQAAQAAQMQAAAQAKQAAQLQQQQERQRRAQAQAQQKAAKEDRTIPESGWQYVDPKGNIQGPFTLQEMQLWNSMGYFRADLKMRWDDGEFVEYNKIFPAGQAFQVPPRRPNGR